MSTFEERLQSFVRNQEGKSEREVQNNAHALSREIQEYAPKERWGNIFKYVVAYALGIGLGHALAAALTRGADELAGPSGLDTEQVGTLADSIEAGHFDEESFCSFVEGEGIEDVPFEDIEADMPGEAYAFSGTEGSDLAAVGDVGSDVPLGDLGDAVGSVLG